MIELLGHHEVLLLFGQLFLILAVARGLGELATRGVIELGADVSTNVVVGDGAPEHETLELAAEREDDLIVTGTNLRPLSGKAFFGHRVEHVVTHADPPVAVVASP